MNSSIVIQCFCKPIETLQTLESLEKCKEIIDYNLVLYVDYSDDTRFSENNALLIKNLKEYIKKNEKLYKSIDMFISDVNLGPYQCCHDAIEYAFKNNQFVVFSEDDIIFCKDSIKYYNDFRDKKMYYDDNCVGITTSSIYFYAKEYIYSKMEGIIKVSKKYQANIDEIKSLLIENNILTAIQKVKWAPNKQMGLFKKGWNKIRKFRDLKNNHSLYEKSENLGHFPDYVTGNYVKNSPFFFIYSFIPRSNDIGLFNELGCTTLYYNGNPRSDLNCINTIKYLTSDDFNIAKTSYNYFNNLNEFTNIWEKCEYLLK